MPVALGCGHAGVLECWSVCAWPVVAACMPQHAPASALPPTARQELVEDMAQLPQLARVRLVLKSARGPVRLQLSSLTALARSKSLRCGACQLDCLAAARTAAAALLFAPPCHAIGLWPGLLPGRTRPALPKLC